MYIRVATWLPCTGVAGQHIWCVGSVRTCTTIISLYLPYTSVASWSMLVEKSSARMSKHMHVHVCTHIHVCRTIHTCTCAYVCTYLMTHEVRMYTYVHMQASLVLRRVVVGSGDSQVSGWMAAVSCLTFNNYPHTLLLSSSTHLQVQHSFNHTDGFLLQFDASWLSNNKCRALNNYPHPVLEPSSNTQVILDWRHSIQST